MSTQLNYFSLNIKSGPRLTNWLIKFIKNQFVLDFISLRLFSDNIVYPFIEYKSSKKYLMKTVKKKYKTSKKDVCLSGKKSGKKSKLKVERSERPITKRRKKHINKLLQ